MPKDTPGQRPVRPILAAGAVLSRPGPDGPDQPEVAVVHRPRYDDWSLPKGKLDPGETLPVAAVREVAEETGFQAELGRRLTAVTYPVEQGIKKVVYWAARAHDTDLAAEFVPNREVDKLVWLSVRDAMARLQYPYDRKVLRRFAKNRPTRAAC